MLNHIRNLLVKIPGGEITMRDDRKKATWNVIINPFRMLRIPVTQKMFYFVTNESPGIFKGENRPVENVSWFDSVQFCNKLSILEGLEPCYQINNNQSVEYNPHNSGYRLPSEAQWEYACKAGSKEPTYGNINDIAWYKNNSNGETHEVGEKVPNNWGLYDTLGNVWEWCSDIYDETVYGSYRIFLGGGWNDDARGCLATNRRRSHPASFKIDDLGFRIARNMD